MAVNINIKFFQGFHTLEELNSLIPGAAIPSLLMIVEMIAREAAFFESPNFVPSFS